jgi:uncharacterized protein
VTDTETAASKALALQFMDINNRNDAEALVAMYADDATHEVMGTTPISGIYTAEQMKQSVPAIYGPFPDGKPLTIRNVVAEGDTVVVEIESPARHESGKMYHQFICWVLKFKDGKIVSSREYLDTQLVLEVLCDGGDFAPTSPDV